MSFFAKVKQWLGIGGVQLNLNVSGQVPKDSGQIKGNVEVTSKSDQKVKKLEFKLLEKWTTGRGEDKETEEFELGIVSIDNVFEIKAGESKNFDFTLPYQLLKSENEKMKEKGGVVGGLGKMGSLLDGEKSKYEVWVDADIEGTAFGPNDFKEIKLV